jgi:3-deoxy-D-manno-octulosonate 8-phosphate phosphatase (KDO 8-P phosphatase)
MLGDEFKSVRKLFEQHGGYFPKSDEELVNRWKSVNTLIFDWDGVFNDGSKNSNEESCFSEIDSMGINLLRYSMYKTLGTKIKCIILSGMGNPAAIHFAKREHFDAAFLGFKNKMTAFETIKREWNIEGSKTAFWFDDVLDISLASVCGFRIHIKQTGSLMLQQYIRHNQLSEYSSALPGGQGAIRESCEWILGLTCQYNEVLTSRSSFDESYAEYYNWRQQLNTMIWKPGMDGNPIKSIE